MTSAMPAGANGGSSDSGCASQESAVRHSEVNNDTRSPIIV